jgi:hypothetical protein
MRRIDVFLCPGGADRSSTARRGGSGERRTLPSEPQAARANASCYTRSRPERLADAPIVLSYLFRFLGIVICGAGGGLLAWVLVSQLGWTGVPGALAAAFFGMVIATLLWIGAVALSNTVRPRK